MKRRTFKALAVSSPCVFPAGGRHAGEDDQPREPPDTREMLLLSFASLFFVALRTPQ